MRALLVVAMVGLGCTRPPPAPPSPPPPMVEPAAEEPVPSTPAVRPAPPPPPPHPVAVLETLDAGPPDTTSVHITTEPPDASVSINHRDVGHSPLTLSLSVRQVFGVRAEYPGFEPAEQTLWPGPKRPTEVALTLTPTPLPPEPPDAGLVTLYVDSNPIGAAVFVDQEDAGTTPLVVQVTPGSHELVFFAAGFVWGGQTVDAGPGETVHAFRRLPPAH